MSKSNTNPNVSREHLCACGCETATRNAFAPGHDNRLFGQVIRGEKPESALAPFPGLMRKLENRANKAAAVAERKVSKVESIGTDNDGQPILVDETGEHIEPSFTRVKIGRWTYEVKSLAYLPDTDPPMAEVTYYDRRSNARTTIVGVGQLV